MMKRILCALMLIVSAYAVKAGPGDTTWVQVFNGDSLTHYGDYDKAVTFPNGALTYRKIYMVFTMGEYNCPAGSQYCHQWDYTVQNYIMTSTGDTFELNRFITPYATSGTPRFPGTWKQRYIFDATDFYSVLKNNAALRVHYSGYSWGFTMDVKFVFIEGVPERNVLKIDRLWHGSFSYGNAADPFDSHLQALTKTAPAGTQSAEMKFMVTGHGSDAPQQCCEFAPHDYSVLVNGNVTEQKTVWKNDCGLNELYPQGGTWLYDRGNWCPGAIVNVNHHKLASITAGNNYSVDINFDNYTNSNPGSSGYGSYTLEGAVYYYGNFNHTVDASIEDIIAPTNYEGYYRENPAGSRPVIRVRNSGSATITSISFAYNVKDSSVSQYTWNGSLASLHDTDITLPVLNAITNLSVNASTGLYNFKVRITAVNGNADNDATNDSLSSMFTIAPTWPKQFVVNMKTNSEGIGGVGQNPSETSWTITDMNDNVIFSRTNANISTNYSDTISIVQKGFYKLTINDGGCDGLHWWVWDQTPSAGITAGSVVIRRIGSITTIPMSNYNTSGSYHDDFGCQFIQYFTTEGSPTGIDNISALNSNATILAFPNPAKDNVHISIEGLHEVNGTIKIVDAVGRNVFSQKLNSNNTNINTGNIAAGAYNVFFIDEENHHTKLQTKLLIIK